MYNQIYIILSINKSGGCPDEEGGRHQIAACDCEDPGRRALQT